MKKVKDNRGMTLIELILSVFISSIIVIVLSTMSITSIKIFERIYNSIEIQQQGHFIMDFMTNKIIHSNKIDSVLDYNNICVYNTNKEVSLGEIKFKDISLENGKWHVFSIQKDYKVEGRSMRYGNRSPATIEAGNYVDSIHVKPLPEKSSYSEAKGINISITMKKGENKMKLSKNIYFRKFDIEDILTGG